MKQCQARVNYDGETGLVLDVPRQCKRIANIDSYFCAFHEAKPPSAVVSTTEGGCCVWCTREGRVWSSVKSDVRFAMCDDCIRDLVIEVRRLRKRVPR